MEQGQREKLTPKEKNVYEFIRKVIRCSGYAPSVRDIQDSQGIKSTSTVHAILDRLENKGYIQKTAGKSRAIRTNDAEVQAPAGSISLPLVGAVAAGAPLLAVENVEQQIVFPLMGRSYAAGELYALRVKGESMINVGIHNGDIVVVRKQNAAEDGQIVVALLENEATVKTFYREKDRIRLQPENDTMRPIYAKEVLILGRVIACLTYFDR